MIGREGKRIRKELWRMNALMDRCSNYFYTDDIVPDVEDLKCLPDSSDYKFISILIIYRHLSGRSTWTGQTDN